MKYVLVIVAAIALASCAIHKAPSHAQAAAQTAPAQSAGNCVRSDNTGAMVTPARGVLCTLEPNDYIFTSLSAAQTDSVPDDSSKTAFPVGHPGFCIIGDVQGNVFACTVSGTPPWIWATVPTFTDDAGYLKDGVTVYLRTGA